VEFTAEDLPAVQMVLNRPEYDELRVLVRCVRAALEVGLEYPVPEAHQLGNFLRGIHPDLDVAWLEERFPRFLPVQDEDDFIEKARLAVRQVLILEYGGHWPPFKFP
jgi:hypothetical protein